MRLSTKSRHAVMAMLDLSIHDRFGPVTLMDIAENQHISLSYLEQLFARLRKHGLVDGTRGPGGGYRLGRPADKISVADIIVATDGSVGSAPFTASSVYHQTECAITHELWKGLSHRIYEFLNSIQLSELVDQPEVHAILQSRNGLHAKAVPSRLSSSPLSGTKGGWGTVA